VQATLVAGGRIDIHRALGVAGAVLAAIVFVAGVAVSIETLRRNGGPPGGDPRKFFAIPLGDIIVFGALVGAAVLQRMRPETHKRLMLLATISLLTAAVGRFLRQVGVGGAPNLFYGTDAFVLALVLFDLATRGRLHPATLWGGTMVVVFKPLLFYAILRRRYGSRSPMRCVDGQWPGAPRGLLVRRPTTHLDLRVRPLWRVSP
jgi:hypothetical protein